MKRLFVCAIILALSLILFPSVRADNYSGSPVMLQRVKNRIERNFASTIDHIKASADKIALGNIDLAAAPF